MNTLCKSLITLGVTSALMSHQAQAATYEVIDLGLVDTVKNTFGLKQNNNGEAVIFGNGSYNFPIQYQNLTDEDFEEIQDLSEERAEDLRDFTEITDSQLEDLKAGNPDANALWWATQWLRGRSPAIYQNVGDSTVLKFDGVNYAPITIFDQPFEETGQLTRSTAETPNGITDNGWIFGTASAPVLPLEPYIDKDDEEITYWVSEFSTRGFISINGGDAIGLEPIESTYGGISQIFDINNVGQVVGSSSVSLDQDEVTDLEEKCILEGEERLDQPQEYCIFVQKSTIYEQRAVRWNLDSQGQIIGEPELLGTAVDDNRNPEDTRTSITSIATAINDNGVAVGSTAAWIDADETEPSETERFGFYAAVFKNGQVIEFTDRDDFFESRGTAINNNGIMTGYMYGYVNGKARTKVFYADTNQDNIETQMVDDFFPGSGSIGFAINDNDIIVGEGEYENFNDSASNRRRRHGFMYNIRTEEFIDINDLLSCDSEYTIIEARDINNQNEIVATALMKQPQRDAKGELFYNANGELQMEDVFRAVYLRPIEGEIEECGTDEEKVERKGAGFNPFLVAGLVLLTLFRRRR
ncbi:DUF3466 family protein [Thalassotalea sp. PS06]|uniref:DUF3466 family protein n=1 Tax=Thalassotalea sp. PS06 TaxID=2594005 RepID=UPI0011630386|nr:DUF3466 family protein [Thalassotalea sp. PS06]QDP01382.1 DUF3466 family protein [Thalassotalea sp. PS06]